MTASVFPAWRPEFTESWGRRPACLPHTLHESPLFSRAALVDLIGRCPPAHYALVNTSRGGTQGQRWREGDIAGVDGNRVIDMIGQGTLWLNLRDVGRIDDRYGALLQQAYDELSQRVPGFAARDLKMGILISSPGARVHYHCDLPGQALWQIAGRKRVYVYPAQPPYLRAQDLENIAYSGFEFKLEYRPEYDAAAQVFELEPGGVLSWPLNAPHRIENHDEVNISVTTEHWTETNRRAQRLHVAHAVMRQHLGMAPRSQTLDGAGYWAKSVLQAAWRRGPWAERTQRAHRPIEFKLALDAPGGMVDVEPVAQSVTR